MAGALKQDHGWHHRKTMPECKTRLGAHAHVGLLSRACNCKAFKSATAKAYASQGGSLDHIPMHHMDKAKLANDDPSHLIKPSEELLNLNMSPISMKSFSISKQAHG